MTNDGLERIGQLYAAHSRDAVGFAYLLTGDKAAAEDLVQDAFVRCIGRLRHLRHPGSFQAYLRQTVLNLVRMKYRKEQRERKYLGVHARRQRTVPETDPSLAPALKSALMELSLRQRSAIVARYYLDLPDSETAILLNCSEGSVRSLISRGTDELRKRWRT